MVDPADPRIHNADYSATPERRMWIAVLQTFIDDIYYYSHTKQKDKRRKYLIAPPKDPNEIHWTDDSLESTMYQARHYHVKMICELIDLDHRWFINNLEKLTKNPEKYSRPRINQWS